MCMHINRRMDKITERGNGVVVLLTGYSFMRIFAQNISIYDTLSLNSASLKLLSLFLTAHSNNIICIIILYIYSVQFQFISKSIENNIIL